MSRRVMKAKKTNGCNPTDPERNGPAHNNSNGAAVGGTANQVPGVGRGAGGPGDGQGPGRGAGQGQPRSEQNPNNSDEDNPSDTSQETGNQLPQNSDNLDDVAEPFTQPEPQTTSTPQTSAQSTDNQAVVTASTAEPGLLQDDGILQIKHSSSKNSALRIDLTAASRNINRLAFLKVDYDPLIGVSIDGQEANNSIAFRNLVQDNLVNPNGSEIYIGGTTQRSILWDLNHVDAGHYAPVMITKSGDVLTIGCAADNCEHVLVTGGDTFNFEDLLSNQKSDWDYNDLTVKLTET